MNCGRTVFSQILGHLPWYEFQKCVARYRGDYQQKSFSCWDQFLAMSFAQLTYRKSLRDIEALKCAEIRSGRHAAAFSSQYSWCNPPRTGFTRTKCRLGRQWRLPDGGGDGMIGAGIPGPRLL